MVLGRIVIISTTNMMNTSIRKTMIPLKKQTQLYFKSLTVLTTTTTTTTTLNTTKRPLLQVAGSSTCTIFGLLVLLSYEYYNNNSDSCDDNTDTSTSTGTDYHSVSSFQKLSVAQEQQQKHFDFTYIQRRWNTIVPNSYSQRLYDSLLNLSSLLLLRPTTIISTTQLEDASFIMDSPILTKTNNESGTSISTESNSDESTTTILNWSGTHSVNVPNNRYYEPSTIREVEDIVQYCQMNKIPIRPMGSALSPNGISFNTYGMMNMSNLDEIINVNTINNTITVQAGARVSQVIDTLRSYNLTLPNLASIAEQQMGGFVQVSAHGTGQLISPIDHYVTSITIVTPAVGTVTLTEETHGTLFHLVKVGLGCFGIVVQLTIQCIPSHKLIEHTYILTRQQAKEQIQTLLQQHKHIRYMWIPYTDTVVVVTNDPEHSTIGKQLVNDMKKQQQKSTTTTTILSNKEKLQPFINLLIELDSTLDINTIHQMGFGELRDAVLSYNPLNPQHVQRCNITEAQFWNNSIGYQLRPSDELLQFDCGGQQWVWEVCFPTGTNSSNNGSDIKFMEELLYSIEQNGGTVPAHAPIEQRWTASSSSLMSPAHSINTNDVFTWVGIINYLPSNDDNENSDTTVEDDTTSIQQQRTDITKYFKTTYCDLMKSIGTKYNIKSHWAKIEIPPTTNTSGTTSTTSTYKLIDLRLQIQDQYPVEKFNQLRSIYDPKNILSNHLIDTLFGPTTLAPTPTPSTHK